MREMPEYVKSLYDRVEKGDYYKQAQIALEEIDLHPDDREYIQAYIALFLQFSGKFEECISHCLKVLPQFIMDDCIEDTERALINSYDGIGALDKAVEVI